MSDIIDVDKLKVEVYDTRQESGNAAAMEVAQKINEILKVKNSLRMIFAAAPSQNELLSELIKIKTIEWNKITAFHMDEYVGIDPQAPQAFGQFLRERLFDKVAFKEINIIKTKNKDLNEICSNYSDLLLIEPIDIVCMGIGENGHIAFNDPPYANFNDHELVKIVELDEVSRNQQVNDGCFQNIEEVPKEAVTLTIPALLSGKYLFVVVPGKTKAGAVKKTLQESITVECPASILREHENAKLYLDNDSASLL